MINFLFYFQYSLARSERQTFFTETIIFAFYFVLSICGRFCTNAILTLGSFTLVNVVINTIGSLVADITVTIALIFSSTRKLNI